MSSDQQDRSLLLKLWATVAYQDFRVWCLPGSIEPDDGVFYCLSSPLSWTMPWERNAVCFGSITRIAIIIKFSIQLFKKEINLFFLLQEKTWRFCLKRPNSFIRVCINIQHKNCHFFPEEQSQSENLCWLFMNIQPRCLCSPNILAFTGHGLFPSEDSKSVNILSMYVFLLMYSILDKHFF